MDRAFAAAQRDLVRGVFSGSRARRARIGASRDERHSASRAATVARSPGCPSGRRWPRSAWSRPTSTGPQTPRPTRRSSGPAGCTRSQGGTAVGSTVARRAIELGRAWARGEIPWAGSARPGDRPSQRTGTGASRRFVDMTDARSPRAGAFDTAGLQEIGVDVLADATAARPWRRSRSGRRAARSRRDGTPFYSCQIAQHPLAATPHLGSGSGRSAPTTSSWRRASGWRPERGPSAARLVIWSPDDCYAGVWSPQRPSAVSQSRRDYPASIRAGRSAAAEPA